MYRVEVTDVGLPLRVMSELAPIKLGRDEFTSDRPDIMLAAHVFFLFFFAARVKKQNGPAPRPYPTSSCRGGASGIYGRYPTNVPGGRNTGSRRSFGGSMD